MKLAISNIAWSAEQDKIIYEKMKEFGFTGLEIAPTRIIPGRPYDQPEEILKWYEKLRRQYGFEIPSMQSIWYGRTESIFGSPEEQEELFSYTYQAIDFATSIGCRNLVFGCPKNRNVPEGVDPDTALPFFQAIAEYALSKGTVIGLEANPPIYHTNYINTTHQAIELIGKVSSAGLRLNLDVGTMLYNQESVLDLTGKVHYINHIHISEPMLMPVKRSSLHQSLANRLNTENYDGFVSIEMGKVSDINTIPPLLEYVAELFGKF